MLLTLIAFIVTLVALARFTNITSLNFDLVVGGMILMQFVDTFAELLGMIGSGFVVGLFLGKLIQMAINCVFLYIILFRGGGVRLK